MGKIRMSGLARKSTHAKGGKKRRVAAENVETHLKEPVGVHGEPSEQEYEIAQLGPIYVQWKKSQKRKEKGKLVWHHTLKDESEHRIWVKWVGAGEETWTAEPQSCFGPEMDQDIQNVLRQKIAWPWPQKDEDGYEQQKAYLLQNGYKKQSDPRLEKTWALEGALRPTEMGLEAGSESDSERSDDMEDEDDEV